MVHELNPIPLFIVKDYSTHSSKTLEQSLNYFSTENTVTRKILSAFSAFREARQVYPVTEENLFSGERVPIIEAEETNEIMLFQLFTGMYKVSFQLLRELLELVLLQFYLHLTKDRQFLQDWIRAKRDTPFRREFENALNKSKFYELANQSLALDIKLNNLYRTLSEYTHKKASFIVIKLSRQQIALYSQPSPYRISQKSILTLSNTAYH